MNPLLLLAAAAAQPAASAPSIALKDIARAVTACARGGGSDVVVCGRRDADSPFRIPESFRDPGFDVDGPVDSVSRERHKLMDVGATGIHSCSATGAGGWTGCMVNDWERDDEQRGFQPVRRRDR